MKLAVCMAIFAGLAALASAVDARQVYVAGFYRPNGTWVPPHYRTVPDGTGYDDPADPNVNPYAGQVVPHPYNYGTPYNYGVPYNYGAPYAAPPAYPHPPGYVPPVPYYGTP